MRIRAVTYNIQSGRDCFGHMDASHAASALRDLAPDVCALNEVRMRTLDVNCIEQARQLGERLNMRWAFGKAIDINGGEYGVALLSRFSILSHETYIVEDVPEAARDKRFERRVVLKCILDTGRGREICALVSHFGLSNAERANATALVLRLLGEETRPCVFMGDLNMPPSDPLIRDIARRIRDTAGTNEFLTHKSSNLKDKIDYIFASSEFDVKATYSPLTYASDHLPVVAELEILR